MAKTFRDMVLIDRAFIVAIPERRAPNGDVAGVPSAMKTLDRNAQSLA